MLACIVSFTVSHVVSLSTDLHEPRLPLQIDCCQEERVKMQLLVWALFFRLPSLALGGLPEESGDCHCCHFSNYSLGYLKAKCTVNRWEELATSLAKPQRVRILDLSNNSLPSPPSGVFENFSNLVELNLSNNCLTTWPRLTKAELTSLKVIDLSNNPAFTSPETLLELRKLREVKGVHWDESECGSCSLIRNYTVKDSKKRSDNISVENLKKGEYIVGNKIHCRGTKHQISKPVQTFAKHGFFPKCLEDNQKCFASEVNVTQIHRCWEIDNLILNAEFAVVPVALVLNAMIFLTTLCTPTLRKNVCMLLAVNMALGDFVVSFYTLMIVCFRKMPYLEFLTVMNVLCQVLGFVWLVGILVTTITSVLLTAERYLAIVYCMNPDRRMTSKHATYLMIASWVVAVAVAMLPTKVCQIGTYTGNTYCIPVHPSKDVPHSFRLSMGLVFIGIVLYLSTIPFYVRIYRFVCKSSQNFCMKREGAVARKIAIVVMTNLLFFLLPVVIALIWLVTDLEKHMTPVSKEILTGVVPTICFSFNSLLNPLLYAFRNEKFQRVLKEKRDVFSRKSRSLSASSGSSTKSGRARTLSALITFVRDDNGNGRIRNTRL